MIERQKVTKAGAEEEEEGCRDYQRVARALSILRQAAPEQPSLEWLSAKAELSPAHFQKLFLRWAGVTPKRFLQYLSKEHAKELLREGATALEVCHATGLSGGGRLHDLIVRGESVTPGEFARGGQGVEIAFGVHPSPYGQCLLACTDRGICSLSFVDRVEDEEEALTRLRKVYPEASVTRDEQHTSELVRRVFARKQESGSLGLQLRGSAFQLQIWQALMALPMGSLTTYGQLATRIDKAGAARAVGTAMAENLVAYLIPCHRVIRAGGEIGQYHWGSERKRAMIARESALRAIP